MLSRRSWMAALGMAPAAWAAGEAANGPVVERETEAKLLLMGNWADPTILKRGADYYMTHSSFDFHPGLLIWHSRDLHHWKPLVRTLPNQEGSVWAPELIEHQGTLFLYYPANRENFVLTAEKAEGPWSAPTPIGAPYIDPGHAVGADGTRYIHLSGGNVVKMAADGRKAIGTPRKNYEGWPIPQDWPIECFCLESPKITQRKGWYYMTTAQGGTVGPSRSHMMVSARGRTPLGPWENSPYNPIIRTWRREEEWWSKGHGTLVEGPGGQWYCVLHGIRNGYRSLGRPTLIEPIEWTADGWFRVAERWPPGWEKPATAEMPMSDDFRAPKLGIQWQLHGLWEPARVQVGDGTARLRAHGASAGESRPLVVMPMHLAYEVEVDVTAEGAADVGLGLFASPKDYLGYALSPDGKLRRVQEGHKRYARTDEPTLAATTGATRTVQLRLVNDRQDLRFYWRQRGGEWRILQPSMDVAAAAPLRVALMASGEGQGIFRDFRYRVIA